MWSVWIVVLCRVLSTHAYNTGAPDINDVCRDMLPGHGVLPQDSPSPFEVVVDDFEYTSNSTLQVTLTSTGTTSFKGFLLQARLVRDDDVMVGYFLEDDDLGVHSICEDQALTHSALFSGEDHFETTVTWVAPDDTVGDIKFRATFVNEPSNFWMGVLSDVISDPSYTESPDITDDPEMDFTSSAPPEDVDLNECGQSMSCFRSPSKCETPNTCDVIVTWAKNKNLEVDFEISGSMSSNRYMAVGLSKDTNMGDTSVMDCIQDDSSGQVTIQMSYNDGYRNSPLNDPQLGMVPGSLQGFYNDGRLICRLSRYITTETDTLFDLLDAYHIEIARGPAVNGVKVKHDSAPLITVEKVNLSLPEFVDIGGIKPSYPLIKAHAIIMVFAWMLFASIGVLMPRHMKTAWSQWKPFGKQLWFVIHQPFMIMVALLTLIGVILAFVEAEGYSKLDGVTAAHPPIGITVGILVVINPLMSVFRCAPDNPRRRIFNIAHLLVGQSAHVLAVVAIFLGLYTDKAGLPDWTKWVMVAFIVWHVLCELMLYVGAGLKSDTEKKSIYNISGMDEGESTVSLKTIVACLHAVGVASFAITLVVVLALEIA